MLAHADLQQTQPPLTRGTDRACLRAEKAASRPACLYTSPHSGDAVEVLEF